MQFQGYRRPDGKVGVRNHVLILPASVCASDTTRMIAGRVLGTVSFNNQNGCAQVGPDLKMTMDVLSGFAANPNVYGTIVVSLGCETCQMDLVVSEIEKRTNKPIRTLIIQEAGGTLKTVERGVLLAEEMVAQAALLKREPVSMSELIVGTECGGSDPTSGIAANPLVGRLSDLLVELGATSILSETTEFIGAEHILARRCRNEAVGRRIYEIVHRYEKAMELIGEQIRNGNPSPGNKAGGITTLEEKSLGCIHKGGSSTINAVYDYAETVGQKGLVVMDTPGQDTSSLTGMIAGGAQLCVFTTGRGTPTGHPIAPVIKITGNRLTFARMGDNIDFDASGIVYGTGKIEALAEKLLDMVRETADGKPTKAEALGYVETSIARACNYV